jgi:hypothetical protein
MPKTNADIAKELARQSSDCSFLLTHLVSQNDGRNDAEARDTLLSILALGRNLSSPFLKATNVGWYASLQDVFKFDPATGRLDGISSSSAVCFTESTLAGLRAHRDVFGVKYGLSFDREWLFSRGANPCINIRDDILRQEVDCKGIGERLRRHVYNFIPAQLHPFVNVVHDSFDATHEREWRCAGDLRFNYNDLRFVFCPEGDFSAFSCIQSHGKPVLFDLAWLDRV